jgi:hypothetical protein
MMRRVSPPSLFNGIGAALGLSLAGAALLAALTPVLGAAPALRAVVALLGLAYLLYLLGRSSERTGRVTAVVLWSAAAAAAWFAEPPVGAYVLLHVGMIWLARSLYHHSSMLTALADLGLNVLAVAFAAWAASRSGSAWLALWCFFLVQAFFVLLPAILGSGAHAGARAEDGEAFERAHRAAQAALRRLVETR